MRTGVMCALCAVLECIHALVCHVVYASICLPCRSMRTPSFVVVSRNYLLCLVFLSLSSRVESYCILCYGSPVLALILRVIPLS